MKSTLPIQDAKPQFSAVVKAVCSEGPITITNNGKPVAVIVSLADYELMARPAHRVNTRARERRLKKIFPRPVKRNAVLDDRQ